MIKKILKKSYLLIGLLIFVWIVKDIDFGYLKNEAYRINFFYFALAALFCLLNIFIEFYRWKKIVEFQKIYYSFKGAFFMYGASRLLGIITPGKIGDFSRMAYLKKDGYSVGKSFLGNFLEKILDFVFFFLFVVGGIFYLPFIPQLTFKYAAILKWGILGLAGFIALILLLYKKSEKISNFFSDLWRDLRQFKIRSLLFVFLVTAIDWFVYFLVIYFIAASVGLAGEIGFFYLAFSAAFVVLASLLPISVLGLGTREAVLLFLLLPFGIPKETIILFSLLIMANYLVPLLIFLFCWFKKPLI